MKCCVRVRQCVLSRAFSIPDILAIFQHGETDGAFLVHVRLLVIVTQLYLQRLPLQTEQYNGKTRDNKATVIDLCVSQSVCIDVPSCTCEGM